MIAPVNKNSLKVKVGQTFVSIANMTALNISIDSNVETWNPMELGGYSNSLKTSCGMSISFDLKRTYGDAGNDAIAATMYEVGEDCNLEFQWTDANSVVTTFTGVVNVSSLGGDSTAVENMGVEINVIGKPVVSA